jgi:hypothetical protein
MAFVDALTRVSNAQAFGASAVSTDSIDLTLLTTGKQIGTGEPMGFAFAVTTAGTVADTTVEVISATDAALTAGIIVHGRINIPLALAVAGSLWFAALPMGTPTQRFLGIRAITAGGTISGTAWLTAAQLFSIAPKHYADGFTIS